MEYIKRHMEERVKELSKSYPAILLTGPRQAGKTTMLRSLADSEGMGRKYVTLDDLTERNICYSSYLSTYVEQDVRDISGSIDALEFRCSRQF